jgi:SAM-dependent methyltransferase
MIKLKWRLARLIALLTLRAKYCRRPIDLQKIACQEGLVVACTLDLGSGPKPRNPFGANSAFGVDIRSFDANPNVKKCALGIDCIPFADNFFDAITAYDVLEHIPRVVNSGDTIVFPFVETMNEAWRVLRVGGIFYSETPCFPMKEAFQDPTHVNIMTEDTLGLYFSDKAWARIYGFVGSFSLIAEGWHGSHYCCLLQKVSGCPLAKINDPQEK